MSEGKPISLVKVEFVIGAVLLVVFLIWGMRSCSRNRAGYTSEESAGMQRDSAALRDSLDAAAAAANAAAQNQAGISRDTIGGGGVQIVRERVTPLYVTIEGLNVRQGPGVKYGVVDRLPLYEEVYFLHEVTDSTEQIDLGSITPEAPWVKIRTRKGREGWVYGVGVSYYKMKLEGVE